MENMVNELSDTIEEGAEKVRRQSQRMIREGQGLWADTQTWVRRSPGEAIGVALAVGATLGALAIALSSRRSSRTSEAFDHLAEMGNEGLKPLRSAADRGLGALCNVLEEIRTSLKR